MYIVYLSLNTQSILWDQEIFQIKNPPFQSPGVLTLHKFWFEFQSLISII